MIHYDLIHCVISAAAAACEAEADAARNAGFLMDEQRALVRADLLGALSHDTAMLTCIANQFEFAQHIHDELARKHSVNQTIREHCAMHGIPVTEIKLSDVEPGDMRGLPLHLGKSMRVIPLTFDQVDWADPDEQDLPDPGVWEDYEPTEHELADARLALYQALESGALSFDDVDWDDPDLPVLDRGEDPDVRPVRGYRWFAGQISLVLVAVLVTEAVLSYFR